MKRVLLDENLPKRLKKYFSSALFVTTVPDLGWQSKENGELLTAMSSENLTVLVTADQNLRYQQNLEKFGISIVVIRTYDTRLNELIPHVEQIEQSIMALPPNEQVVEIDLR